MNVFSVPIWCRLGLIAVVAGTLAACDNGSSVEEIIGRAEVLRDNGSLRASVIELKNAIQKDPQNAVARELLGRNYVDLGDGDSADKELRRAIDLGADPLTLAEPLARVLLLQGKYAEALVTAAPAALASGPDRAALLVVQGRAHGSLDDLEQAEAAFRAALNDDRSNIDAHIGLGRTALRQNALERAATILADAAALAPDNPAVIQFKGDLAYTQGDFEAAAIAFVTLVNANPDDPFHRAHLVQVLMADSKTQQALAHLDTILDDFPNYPLANYMRAVIAYEADDYRLAKLHSERSLAALPDHRPSQLIAGAASFAEGQLEQARSYLREFLAAVPEHQQARRLLGQVQLQLGEPAEAMATLTPLVDDGAGDAQLLTIIGSAALQARDLQAGRTYFERLTLVEPGSAAAQAQLGLIQVALGDVEAGIDALSRAVDSDPMLDRAQVALILAHLRGREFTKALEAAERLQVQLPNDTAGYILGGIAHLGLDDEAAARTAFERALEISPGVPDATANLVNLELRSGNVEVARRLLLDVLEHHPDDLATLIRLADVEQRLGDTAAAQGRLEQAVEAHPGVIAPRIGLAQIHLRAGRTQAALDITEDQLIAHPRELALLEIVGRAQMELRRFADAVTTFQQLVANAGDAAQAHYLLALSLGGQLDRRRSRESLESALALDPTHFAAKRSLAILLSQEGELAAADKLVAELREVAPQDLGLLQMAGVLALGQRRFGVAVEVYSSLMVLQPAAGTAVSLAIALEQANELERAERTLLSWLDLNQGDQVVGLALANFYLGQSRLADAAVAYKTLLAGAPDNVTVLNNLAWVMLQEGDAAAALKHGERALALATNEPRVMDTVATILLALDEADRALRLLRRAAELEPESSDIRTHLAQALVADGDSAGARVILTELLDGDALFDERPLAEALLGELTGR